MYNITEQNELIYPGATIVRNKIDVVLKESNTYKTWKGDEAGRTNKETSTRKTTKEGETNRNPIEKRV